MASRASAAKALLLAKWCETLFFLNDALASRQNLSLFRFAKKKLSAYDIFSR